MSEATSEQRRNAAPILEEIRRAHRALAILRALERSPCVSCNDRVLGDYLDRLSLGGTREAIRSTLDVLQRAGALRCVAAEDVIVVTLTERGAELASGMVTAEDVARPGPECLY